jgi:hypothetical protein
LRRSASSGRTAKFAVIRSTARCPRRSPRPEGAPRVDGPPPHRRERTSSPGDRRCHLGHRERLPEATVGNLWRGRCTVARPPADCLLACDALASLARRPINAAREEAHEKTGGRQCHRPG